MGTPNSTSQKVDRSFAQLKGGLRRLVEQNQFERYLDDDIDVPRTWPQNRRLGVIKLGPKLLPLLSTRSL